MDYLQLLKETANHHKSIVCLGMDPLLDKIPIKGSIYKRIVSFYEGILEGMRKLKTYPGAVKPNYAFYAQYGLPGIKALHKVITIYKSEGFPVILDVKRGDIGTTAEAYAKEAFDFFSADAVTLSPYMGYDSIRPFIDNYPDKGYYILTKTSNKSSADIQDIKSDSSYIYEIVANKIIQWYHPGIGSVIGATYPQQLSSIISLYNISGKEIPLLIPGVGSQGGSVKEIVSILRSSNEIQIHRINSSSAINYAYLNKKGLRYSDAAAEALSELNEEIDL